MDYTDELTGSFLIDVMKETGLLQLSSCLTTRSELELKLQAAEAFLAMGLRSFFLHSLSSMISCWCLDAVLPVMPSDTRLDYQIPLILVLRLISIALIAVCLPFTPVGPSLGFVVPPMSLMGIVAVILVLYTIGMETTKFLFYRYFAD